MEVVYDRSSAPAPYDYATKIRRRVHEYSQSSFHVVHLPNYRWYPKPSDDGDTIALTMDFELCSKADAVDQGDDTFGSYGVIFDSG